MSLIDKLINGFSTRSAISDHVNDFMSGTDTPITTKSGAMVTVNNSMTLTAVYSCVRLLSWTIAGLPLQVFKKLKTGGKEIARDEPLYRLLHDSPNKYQTSFQWRALMTAHQNLWGAGISEIEFDRQGQPVALWVLPPWLVEPKKTKTGDLFYRVDLGQGNYKNLRPEQLLIITTLSTSAFEWQSPIALHRETIGAAMAVNEFGAKMFSQGVNPAAILTPEQRLNENAEKSLVEEMKKYSGLGGAHRLMLLKSGMKFEKVGLPPEDAQYLQTRTFDVSEIARIYNVPLFMLQSMEKSTSWGTGLEEQTRGFVTWTLLPYVTQFEAELTRKLFFGIKLKKLYPKFNLEGLLRANLKDRVAAYKALREMGVFSIDEIRELEDRNPIGEAKGGNEHMIPLNMQSSADLGKEDEDEDTTPPPAPKDEDDLNNLEDEEKTGDNDE